MNSLVFNHEETHCTLFQPLYCVMLTKFIFQYQMKYIFMLYCTAVLFHAHNLFFQEPKKTDSQSI